MDVEQPVGKALPRDISSIEKIETDLDIFIEKRHAKRVADEGERAEAEAWKESVREQRAAAEEAARQRPRQEFFGKPQPRRQVGSRIF